MRVDQTIKIIHKQTNELIRSTSIQECKVQNPRNIVEITKRSTMRHTKHETIVRITTTIPAIITKTMLKHNKQSASSVKYAATSSKT